MLNPKHSENEERFYLTGYELYPQNFDGCSLLPRS